MTCIHLWPGPPGLGQSATNNVISAPALSRPITHHNPAAGHDAPPIPPPRPVPTIHHRPFFTPRASLHCLPASKPRSSRILCREVTVQLTFAGRLTTSPTSDLISRPSYPFVCPNCFPLQPSISHRHSQWLPSSIANQPHYEQKSPLSGPFARIAGIARGTPIPEGAAIVPGMLCRPTSLLAVGP
jgi:hypothetical protein